MEETLRHRVVGQDTAISLAAPSGAPRGVSPPTVPSAPSFSSGPPGSARPRSRASSEVPLRRTSALVRFDMSEYMEKHASPGSSARPPATWVSRRAASSPRRCGAGPTPWCSSTRSRRRTPTSSTCCSRSGGRHAAPTRSAERRLQEHDDDHDVEHRDRRDQEPGDARLPEGGRRGHLRQDEGRRPRSRWRSTSSRSS